MMRSPSTHRELLKLLLTGVSSSLGNAYLIANVSSLLSQLQPLLAIDTHS